LATSVLCLAARDGKLVQQIDLDVNVRRPTRVTNPQWRRSVVPLFGVRRDALAATGLSVIVDERGVVVGLANRVQALLSGGK
jgi:hypothetical protein